MRRIIEKQKKLAQRRLKQLRAVRQAKTRLEKKNAELKNILTELEMKSLITSDESKLLESIDPANQEFIKRFTGVISTNTKYSQSLRKFALCLHFISPRAYCLVRDQFNTCLPHPQTLRSWYRSFDGGPGFTDEAFKAISLKALKSEKTTYVSVTFDEMCIHKDADFDGFNSLGVVNIGSNTRVNGAEIPLGGQIIVYMVTAVNDSWKMPVGYFLINSLTGEQKAELLITCLTMLFASNVETISVTCDGCPSNFAMARKLGCDLDSVDVKPYFYLDIDGTKKEICFFPDPSHMYKLVRNTIGDKKNLQNMNGDKISWSYITFLHEMQEIEGLRMANKLTKAHINYKKQIMKVKLATQTISESVANAIEYCEEKFHCFSGSAATVDFIRRFNKLFDVLNSRNLNAHGFKKPINRDNFTCINNYLNDMYVYISKLKMEDGIEILKTKRNKGFLGFLCCIRALQKLCNHIMVSQSIFFLPTYKLSQDHLECFFSAIRSKGGFNNNPTPSKFKSAYKRLIVHGELKHVATGNCSPLENIEILTYTNSRYEKTINSTLRKLEISDDFDENDDYSLPLDNDHDYLPDPTRLTEYTKEIVQYIAGFVTTKISKIVKCENCLILLVSDEEMPDSLIFKKDKGGLHRASRDVVYICEKAEKILRNRMTAMKDIFTGKNIVLSMINECFKICRNVNLFRDHGLIYEQSPLNNHTILLIKAVAFKYLQIRLYYIAKRASEPDEKIRNLFNKLMLFKNQ